MASQSRIDRLVDSFLWTLKAVGSRVLVHCCGLIPAIAAWQAHSCLSVSFAVSIYAGIICLIPYGSPKNPYWWIPVGAGMLQALALFMLGWPWYWLPLAAGLQTWLLRLIIAKGNIGWDWSAAPLLIFSLFSWFGVVNRSGLPMVHLATIPVIFGCGWLAFRQYNRVFHKRVHRQLLAATLARLRQVLATGSLEETHKRHCSLLLSQSEALGLHGDGPEDLVDRIVNVTGEIEDLSRTLANRPDWSRKLFKSTQWQHMGTGGTRIQGGRLTADDVMRNVSELNAELARVLAALTKKRRPEDGDAQSASARLDALNLSAGELLGKKDALPAAYARVVEDIAFISMDIINAMRKDPRDIRSSAGFLGRYLPRVHHLVDEYRRMEQQLPPETAQRALEVLQHMSSVFDEHRRGMTRNDGINFTAELDALDTLLKMNAR